MFKDNQIIKLIETSTDQLTDKLIYQDGFLSQLKSKIEDLQDTTLTTNGMIDDMQVQINKMEKKMYSDEQVKKMLKQAMKEFKEEMEKPVKKVVKKK